MNRARDNMVFVVSLGSDAMRNDCDRTWIDVVEQDRKTQAQFECAQCGFEANADVVGAINVLRAGHARFACQVSGAIMPPATGTHRSDSGKAPCQA